MERGSSIFCKIISRNRFQDTLGVLQFDDAAAQRRSGRSPNKFSSVRNVFYVWNESLFDAFVSGQNLMVNEQLETFCGCCDYPSSSSGRRYDTNGNLDSCHQPN